MTIRVGIFYLEIGMPMYRVVLLVSLVLTCIAPASAESVYFATGIKIGEVTSSRAIVWTRLTERPSRVGIEAPLPEPGPGCTP